MTDKEIKGLEKRILDKIENPLGKTLMEIADRFDTVKSITQDFKKKVPEKELMDEFEKEIKWLYNNYKLDMNDKEMSRAIDINNLIIDMVNYDTIYRERFIKTYNKLRKEVKWS